MYLIKIIESPLKAYKKRPSGGLHVLNPNEWEVEQAFARAKINGIDTIYIYKG